MISATGKRIGRPTNAELAARFATVEAPIRRWEASDFDEWLASRLQFRWGGEARIWQHRLMGFQSNDYLFITNGSAVLLAMQMRDIMTGKPFVMERFAWTRDADEKDGVYGLKQHEDTTLRPLYRRLREWASGMSATRLYVGVCSDLLPSELREMMGKDSYYIVGAPC